MRKSLQLQAEMHEEFGRCVFDVTLDCEDGAPVGAEVEHARLVCELIEAAPAAARVAVRLHPVDHLSFLQDVAIIVSRVGQRLTHVMIPKVEQLADIERAAAALDAAGAPQLRLHALIESPAAVHRAFDIAAHPRIDSLSFGLMDFVSAHGGAIPASAMSTADVAGVHGQFSHPLVMRAKLDIVAACHAHGKVPSHGVVTEFSNTHAVRAAARRAGREIGCTRMWSIHPSQIRPILEAFAPEAEEVEDAVAVLVAAERAAWAPISHAGQLHDRASYRYFWQVLERAHRTGVRVPSDVSHWF